MNTNIEAFQSLLNHVSIIVKQYEKIAEITGENFNVFEILGLSTNEVKTHTAFISELLNPKGTHGQGDIFLKLFCETVDAKLNWSNARIEKEKFIGYISDDNKEGGSIDIIITDSDNHMIIIENKIYAGDQNNQLLRYHNFGEKNFGDFELYYLTLDGRDASKTSIDNTDSEKYKKISYKSEIIDWLLKCKEKSTNQPILRETLTQYILLIKKLTKQTMTEQMKNDLLSIITSNGSNISSAIEIAKLVDSAKNKLRLDFAKKVEEKLCSIDKDLRIEISDNFGKKWNGMNIKLSNSEEEYVMLSFLSDYNDTYLEIVNKNNKKVKNQINKQPENVKFYKEKLAGFSNWGKIQDAENAWHGDWVCRYEKLDKYFRETKNWALLADNNIPEIVLDVSKDILILIETLKEKLAKQKNV